MSEIRVVGPGKTRGYPYPVFKKRISRALPGPTILISPMLFHPHSVYSILRHVVNRYLPKRVPFPG